MGLVFFTKRDFKAREIVIKWNLQVLNKDEYNNLSRYEQENFCHKRNGIIYLYPKECKSISRSKCVS